MPEKPFESVLLESSTKAVTERESQDWRNLISKTLEAIEKVNSNDNNSNRFSVF